MRATIATLAAAAVLGAGAFLGPQGPVDAQEPPAAATVPLAKLVRVQALYHREQRQARGLRRTLRHRPSVREALDVASLVYGAPRDEIENVAFCESRLNPLARNRSPIYNGERATGLMQMIPSTFARSPFRDLNIYSAYANALAGAYIWSLSRSWREWAPVCRP